MEDPLGHRGVDLRLCLTQQLVDGSPAAAAVSTFLTLVFRLELIDLLRIRRFSFWRFRLICDLMLAMLKDFRLVGNRHSGVGSVRRKPHSSRPIFQGTMPPPPGYP